MKTTTVRPAFAPLVDIRSTNLKGKLMFRFPEYVGNSSSRAWWGTDLGESPSRVAWRDTESVDWNTLEDGVSIGYKIQVDGLLTMATSLTPFEDHIEWSIRLGNISQKDWHNAFCFNCLGLEHAPDFCDFEMDRTFLYTREGFKLVKELDRESPHKMEYFYTELGARLGGSALIEHFGLTSRDTVTEPLIATLSSDKEFLVACACEQAIDVFNNPWHPCIHSDPLLGDIRVGETKATKGRIYIFRGGLNKLYERFRADFRSAK